MLWKASVGVVREVRHQNLDFLSIELLKGFSGENYDSSKTLTPEQEKPCEVTFPMHEPRRCNSSVEVK